MWALVGANAGSDNLVKLIKCRCAGELEGKLLLINVLLGGTVLLRDFPEDLWLLLSCLCPHRNVRQKFLQMRVCRWMILLIFQKVLQMLTVL